MRQDYKKENGEILAYISVGISCETRVRRNYLCSCAIALMHLTRGRIETDKLLPAAGILRSSLEVCIPSPAHCLILPREHQKLLRMCSCSPPILRSRIFSNLLEVCIRKENWVRGAALKMLP